MSAPLVDLHCHILPGIDDGAKDTDVTVALLEQEISSGAAAVMFTPHFYYERDTLEKFTARRDAAYKKTVAAVKEKGLRIAGKLGAEVHFSTALPSLDLRSLAFEGTDYILIELPTLHMPPNVADVLYDIRCLGLTPIIAHVERYKYVADDPTMLYDWVSEGALAHVNSTSLIRRGKTAATIKKYIEWGIVHFLCSDAHSPHARPANLGEGYALLPDDVADEFKKNAVAVFLGKDVDARDPEKPKHRFGGWV